MAKVITLSRTFPDYHPRAGEPTYFVEKVLTSLRLPYYDEERNFNPRLYLNSVEPKGHTIRAGHRFKTGDMASLRCWSGRSYNSKQIILAPDVEVKCWDIRIYLDCGMMKMDLPAGFNGLPMDVLKNDGLSLEDFIAWFTMSPDFKKTGLFTGQIICWDKDINY